MEKDIFKDIFNEELTRKEFLRRGCIFALAVGANRLITDFILQEDVWAKENVSFVREALYYERIDEETVQCQLCPNRCRLIQGQRGFCRAREPKNGKLYSLVYANPCAVHIDPMEKKPLFHFLPGTPIFSIATAGCNFRCKYCQNWQISQFPPEETDNINLSPKDIVKEARKYKCPSIAYTYSEPSIFYEYMLDTAKEAQANGLKNMYHSNGSLNPEPVKELAFYLDAANIDLKGFTQEFYKEVCAGYLDTVLTTLKILKQKNVWVEITNLIVPTLNDDLVKIKEMCFWIKDNLGPDVPLHFSRFHPQYKLLTLHPTPVSILESARNTAMDVGLKFVYIGNIPGHPAESTYCPYCKKILIRRQGFAVLENNLESGKCKFCKEPIPGVWS